MGVRNKILLLALGIVAAIAAAVLWRKGDSSDSSGGNRESRAAAADPAAADSKSKTTSPSRRSEDRHREPLADAAPSSLKGQIREFASGRFLEGAEIEIKLDQGRPEPESKTLRRTQSDAAGEFALDSLAAGFYILTIAKPGYSKEYLYDLRIPRKEALQVALFPAAILAGTVRDRVNGKPLPGALVLVDYETPAGQTAHGPEVLTDAKGEFRLDGIRAEQNSILVQAEIEGYARASIREEGPAIGTSKWIDIGLYKGFRIAGQVVDDLERPLGGARISLTDETVRSTIAQTQSDEKGSFSLPESSPDSVFSLTAIKPGYRQAALGALRLPLKSATLRLERLGAIAGTVRSSAGAPIDQFTIRSFQEATRGYRDEEMQKSFSNAGGKFLIENVAPGEIDLLIWSEGWAPLKREKIRLAPGERLEGFQIVLEKGALAEGRVFSPGGQPVAGAAVYLIEKTRNGLVAGIQGPSYSTDSLGRFQLPGIPRGPGTLRIAKSGFAEKLVPFVCSSLDTLDLGTVGLDRGGRVEGLCLGPYGQPLIGFLVEAYPKNETSPVQTRSDNAGKYRFENLPSGPVDLMGHHPFKLEGISPLHRFHRHVEISGDQAVVADFDYRKGGRVIGKVSSPEENAPFDLVANLIDARGNTVEGSTAVDSSGGFEIHSIREGSYELWIRSPSRDFSSSKSLRVREGETVTIQFHLGESRIAGRILDAAGAPLAGATLVARRTEQDPQGYRAGANESGEFLLEGVEPGIYRLEFTKEGYGPAVIPQYVAGAGDGPLLQIALHPSISLKLSVKSVSGQALPKTVVRLEKTGDPLFPGSGDAESGPGGDVFWSSLTEGHYTAKPVGEDVFPSTLSIQLGSGAKASGNLVVRRRGNLRVTLRHGDKHVLKDIQVGANLAGAEIAGSTAEWAKQGKIAVSPQTGFTDSDGRILFVGIPEGDYDILVLGGVQSKKASVKPGTTAEVFFDL